MSFDDTKFKRAKYVPRTEEVPVAALKEFFDKDEKPVFKVRGLTASELARCNEANDNTEKMKAVIEALTSTNKNKQRDAFKDVFGLGSDTPAEIMKRVMMLTTASVDPELSQDIVVKIAEVAPIEFYHMTNKITELTGQGGMIEGKSRPSGQTQESESPVNSEKKAGASSSK